MNSQVRPTLHSIMQNSGDLRGKIVRRLRAVDRIVCEHEQELLDAYALQLTNRRWAKRELRYFHDKLTNFEADLALAAQRIQQGELSPCHQIRPSDPACYRLDDLVCVMGSSNVYFILLANVLWARAAGAGLAFRPGRVQRKVHCRLKEIVDEHIQSNMGAGQEAEDLAWMFTNCESSYEPGSPLIETDGTEFVRAHLRNAPLNNYTKFMMFTGALPTKWPNVRAAFETRPRLAGLIEGGGNDRMYVEQGADLGLAAHIALRGIGSNGGMTCMRPKVIVVHESDYAGFKKVLRERFPCVQHGRPTDEGTMVSAMPVKSALGRSMNDTIPQGFLGLAQEALNHSDSDLIAYGQFDDTVQQGECLHKLRAPDDVELAIFRHPSEMEMAYVPALAIAPGRNHAFAHDARAIYEEMFGPGLVIVRVADGDEGIEEVKALLLRPGQRQLTFTYVGDQTGSLHHLFTNLMRSRVAEQYTNVSLWDPGQFGPQSFWGTGPMGAAESSARVYHQNGSMVVEPAGRRDFIEAFTHICARG